VDVSPWVAAIAVGVPAIGKVIIVAIALRKTKPGERASILSAIAELFPASSLARTRRKSVQDERHGISR
jgi:hypothetical protein